LLLVSCARYEPPLPKDAIGWSDYKEGSTKFRGRFLLHTGESTENGKLRVTVLELLAPKLTGDGGDFEARARAKLGFARVSDGKTLCWKILPENGGGNLSECADLADEYGIFGAGIRAINLNEGWVYFVLDGIY